MLRATLYTKSKHKSFKLAHATFAVPALALASLAALGISFINYNPEDFASATNATVSSKISYKDEYITISNPSLIDLSTEEVTANDTYVYATNNVTVSTNVETGYELYLTSANKESAALTADNGYNTKINATSGTGGELGTPAVLGANTYGYAIDSGTIGNTKFDADYTSPTSTSKWAKVPAGTQDRIRSSSQAAKDGETTTVHYGANVNNALAPGEYKGSVIYSAVVTPTNNEVEMSVSPNYQTSLSVGDTIVIKSGPSTINKESLLDNNEVKVLFRQKGAIKGDCKVTEVEVRENEILTKCTPPDLVVLGTYDITITIPRYGFTDNIPNGFERREPDLSDITYMQDATSSLCAQSKQSTSATNFTTYNIKDKRTEVSYHVRKLSDGNCWMVDNLYLTGGTSLTSSDSNVTTTYTLPESTTTNTKIYNGTQSTGSFFNRRTAKAGKDSSVENDVCPKKWRLFNRSESQQIVKISDIKLFYSNSTGSPVSPVLPGYYFLTLGHRDSGTKAYYWSGTLESSSTLAGYLISGTKTALGASSLSGDYAGSIRCILTSS